MAEEENNNFNCHTTRVEKRRQFQFCTHEEKWRKRNKTILTVTCREKNTRKKNGQKGKTTISIFTREEKWRERKEDNLNIQEAPCPHFN